MGQATALQTGGQSSARPRMASRDQIRRIPHARPPRPWKSPVAVADRPRLDAQIPGDSRGRVCPPGKAGVFRRRALRGSPRRKDLVQYDPDSFGCGHRRRPGLLSVRPSLPRWRCDQRGPATRAKGAAPAASVGYRPSAAFLRSPDRMRPGVLCQGLRDVAEGIISKRADAPIHPPIAAYGSRSSARTEWSS